ncbi:hypothetical protein MOC12_21135 [Bacillus spizizenii]|nr:hypothetical protein [Bacillus spizizenii]
MSTLRTIKLVELKLQNGVQQYSAQEVATLLNEIRVLKGLLSKERGKDNV